MLEFSAHEYVEISQQFAFALASASKREPSGVDVSKALKKLIEETNRLSLFVTREALGQFLLEIVNKNPGLASLSGQGDDRILSVKNPFLDDSRWSYHIECVLATLKAELKSIAFRVIPAGKTIYCDPNWLAGRRSITSFQTHGRNFNLLEDATHSEKIRQVHFIFSGPWNGVSKVSLFIWAEDLTAIAGRNI